MSRCEEGNNFEPAAKSYAATTGLSSNRRLDVRLCHLSGGVRVGGLRDDLGLAGFDEDEGGDQDDQYGYQEGDNDWLDGRVSYALFGSRVARCGLCSLMDVGCGSGGLG